MHLNVGSGSCESKCALNPHIQHFFNKTNLSIKNDLLREIVFH